MLPNKNTMKNPSVAAIPDTAIKIPRIDAWLERKKRVLPRVYQVRERENIPYFANVSDDGRLHQTDAKSE